MRMLMEDTEKRSRGSFRKVNPVETKTTALLRWSDFDWKWCREILASWNNTSIYRNFDLKIDNKFLTTSQIVLAYDFWDWV